MPRSRRAARAGIFRGPWPTRATNDAPPRVPAEPLLDRALAVRARPPRVDAAGPPRVPARDGPARALAAVRPVVHRRGAEPRERARSVRGPVLRRAAAGLPPAAAQAAEPRVMRVSVVRAEPVVSAPRAAVRRVSTRLSAPRAAVPQVDSRANAARAAGPRGAMVASAARAAARVGRASAAAVRGRRVTIARAAVRGRRHALRRRSAASRTAPTHHAGTPTR